MNKNLVRNVGSIGQDNLFAKLTPAAETFGVVIEKLSDGDPVVVKRGTLLGRSANGKMTVFGGSSEAKTQKFNGDGTVTAFTVTDKPERVDGVKVGDTAATVTDYNPYTGVVTLSAAPAAGTDNVVVSYTAAGSAPSAILADDVELTADADAVGVAYRCGNFNRAAVIAAEGYTITGADEDELRKVDIIFTDVM